MKRILIATLVAATTLPATGFLIGQAPIDLAMADEIIIHRDAPDVVDVPPPPPRDVVIERRRPDCASTTVRREDGLGGSTTTTRRECE